MLKALLLLLLLPAATFADSLITAHIQADWSHLAFRTTGTLEGTAQNTLVSLSDKIDLFIELTAPDTNLFRVESLRRQFWFTGEGTGSLVIDVPYTLTLACLADSVGSVTLSAHAPQTTKVQIGCNEERSGILTASKALHDPYWGPLVGFTVMGTVQAAARVPEASTALLLLVGVIGLVLRVP